MSDWFLKSMWQDIKDPSWPDVEYWDDFIKLKDEIKSECRELHGIMNRVSEIGNPEYWRSYVNLHVLQKDRFVFVCIPKCGSVHHVDFFVNRLGWQKKIFRDIQHETDLVYFGLLMHPIRRYLKGVTEFIWHQGLADTIDMDEFMKFACLCDQNCLPYNIMSSLPIEQVNWIPFSSMSPTQVKQCMNNLLELHGSDIRLPLHHPMLHQSNEDKSKLFDRVKHSWGGQQQISIYTVYMLYASEIDFYQKLIENFRYDWSHVVRKT